MREFALGRGGEQLGAHGGEDAIVAQGVLAQGVDELGRHERGIARSGQEMAQAGAQLVAPGVLQGQAHADAGAQREQILAPQELGEAAVAGEDDAEQRAGVELGAGQHAQLAEHGGKHLLRFVDEEHGAQAGVLEVAEPAVAQGLEAAPAIVGLQGDAEEVAEFAVEVGQATLRVREGADGEVGQPAEAFGEQAQGDRLAGTGIAGDEGEAAFADEALLDARAEEVDLRGHEQGFERQLDREGIPFQAIEGEQFLGHAGAPRARGVADRPAAARWRRSRP